MHHCFVEGRDENIGASGGVGTRRRVILGEEAMEIAHNLVGSRW